MYNRALPNQKSFAKTCYGGAMGAILIAVRVVTVGPPSIPIHIIAHTHTHKLRDLTLFHACNQCSRYLPHRAVF